MFYQYNPLYGPPSPRFYFAYFSPGSRALALSLATAYRETLKRFRKIGKSTSMIMRHDVIERIWSCSTKAASHSSSIRGFELFLELF